MPLQNAAEVDVTSKSGNVTPKNGNLNNNHKDKPSLKLEILKKANEEPEEPTKATIIIPPDGGFAWIVMVSQRNN